MTFAPYHSVRREAEAEITIKRSVFRARVAPCRTKDEAQAYLASIRAIEWNASHNCYAWRLGPHGLESRMSDDGEPSGSAGKPMLFVMQKENVSDVIVVVTRHFGGVKLGIGPLARAYSDATQLVLRSAELWTVEHTEHVRVFCSYDDVSTVTHVLERFNARFQPTYGDAITFEVDIASETCNAMLEEIVTSTNARSGFLKVPAE